MNPPHLSSTGIHIPLQRHRALQGRAGIPSGVEISVCSGRGGGGGLCWILDVTFTFHPSPLIFLPLPDQF